MLRVHWATPLPRATVVRNPFNVRYDAADDLPWPPPAADGVIRMACVGRLDSVSKGQDILFEVLRREKWRARPLRVSLFGRGTQERILRALRERYRLDGVEFAGHVADIEQVWKTHHALVLPSREEGLPLAAVEAMLCARPCVVTGVAGNAEIVSDGVTGFVAASADVCALDAAMERAWERRAEWESMGRAAARRIRELVPPDPVADFARQVEALL
jgi:glycosyltransferase involved in cell wall biosynthesis